MALGTIIGGLTLWPPPVATIATTSISTSASVRLNAASQQTGFIFRYPKSGNVRFVSYYVSLVTSAPTSNHDIRLETVDAATGLNTGTLVATNANNAALLNTTGFKTTQLTADAAVTAGAAAALMFVAPGANFGDIRFGTLGNDISDWPYIRTSAAGKISLSPIMALEYDDGTVGFISGAWPLNATTSSGIFNSGSSPNKRGIRFKTPGKLRLSGCDLLGDLDGDMDFVLYTGGTSATTLLSVDKDLRGVTTGGIYKFDFTTTVVLNANTYYRLVMVPTTATGVECYGFTVSAAKYLDALPGGQDMHYTTVTGTPSAEGDWTNTTTQRIFLAPRFDQLADDAGSGGVATAYGFVG